MYILYSGDPEAWAPSGNCSHHSGTKEEEFLKLSLEPLNTLPPGLLRGLRAVLKGAIGVAISYVVCMTRGFQPYNSNPFVRWCEEFELNMTGKLHNDDIHTYEEVSNCLISLEFQPAEAEQLTVSVDKAGEATVVSSAEPEVLKSTSRLILKENLLFSLVPEDILKVESGVAALFGWVQSLGSGGHAGLRCVVAEALLTNVEAFPEYSSVIEVEMNTDGEERQKQLSFLVAPNRIFIDEEQFPSIIPHLDRDFQPPHLQNPEGLKVYWSEAIKAYSRPFQHCPHSAFAVLVMASPFLSNALKAHVNSVVIYFQHDNYFKFGFSQIFMALYPSLFALYLRFVGTAAGNFFTTSVQLFTANSIVDCLSSDGFESRLFPDTSQGDRPCLTTIFMQLLLTGLSHIGSHGVNRSHKDFLKHAVLTNGSEPRMAHLFRDIDYVLKSPITCSRILAGQRDPLTVSVPNKILFLFSQTTMLTLLFKRILILFR